MHYLDTPSEEVTNFQIYFKKSWIHYKGYESNLRQDSKSQCPNLKSKIEIDSTVAKEDTKGELSLDLHNY